MMLLKLIPVSLIVTVFNDLMMKITFSFSRSKFFICILVTILNLLGLNAKNYNSADVIAKS